MEQNSEINITKLHTGKNLTFYTANTSTELFLPLVNSSVKAGFPSPAADFEEEKIDLNNYVVKNKFTTFFVKVSGDSMKNVGINDGDMLVVDKSLEPQNNKIAVCFIDGDFTVKRIKIEKECIWLIAENESFEPIKITPENDFIIWGIVTHSIKKF